MEGLRPRSCPSIREDQRTGAEPLRHRREQRARTRHPFPKPSPRHSRHAPKLKVNGPKPWPRALSADDESTTAELIAKYGLTYAIGQAPTQRRYRRQREHSSALTRPTCSRPGLCLTRLGKCLAASTLVEPPDSSYQTTSSNWSANCVKTRGNFDQAGTGFAVRATRSMTPRSSHVRARCFVCPHH